ncbi:DUF2946 family protein [Nitrobacter sp.]|uniref:DUF2946 family protein n=1 Tax=Nitrobacter sp. TaxID=29420 RepID=UPI003F654972
MKWFRSNIKHGSRLALLALAIQLVLSFGHHHGTAALASPALASPAVAMQPSGASTPLATKAAVANPARASASAESPAGPASGHHQDSDTCAICAVMALAGTVLFTEPPVLLLPETYHFLYLTTDAEFNHIKPRHVVSQPRAPPAS